MWFFSQCVRFRFHYYSIIIVHVLCISITTFYLLRSIHLEVIMFLIVMARELKMNQFFLVPSILSVTA